MKYQGPCAKHRHLRHSRPAKSAEASSRRRMDKASQRQIGTVRKQGSPTIFWKQCTGKSYFGKNWECMPRDVAGWSRVANTTPQLCPSKFANRICRFSIATTSWEGWWNQNVDAALLLPPSNCRTARIPLPPCVFSFLLAPVTLYLMFVTKSNKV